MSTLNRIIGYCKKALHRQRSEMAEHPTQYPIIYTRDQHPVSRQLISDNAQKVLYRLSKAGFDAYLVGGGVRDILLGITPKDFDIVTNATPEQIKDLFRNCRLIGRRFRLAHIIFGRDIIEVATFRGHHKANSKTDKLAKTNTDGMLLRDNIYGTIDEDAERRDFTVNALYYNIKDFCVYDFAGGVTDIQQGVLKLIGDPETRYREDPVRMLRAVRFAVKLNMTISEQTKAPITKLAELLANIPPARMFEEFNKLFMSGSAVATYRKLQEFDLFKYFFPQLAKQINQGNKHIEAFIVQAMFNTDQRIANNQRVTPAFLLAAMLWHPMQQVIEQLKQQNHSLTPQERFFKALHQILGEQQQSVAIPKRFQSLMKEIWILQERFERRDAKRATKTLAHEKFRAGYDFLLLRAELEQGSTEQLAKWWTAFSQASHHTQQQMLKATGSKARHHSRRRKPKRKAKATNDK